MENEEIKKPAPQESNSRRWTGIVLLVYGVCMLMGHMGVVLPPWIFSWEMLLIVLGLAIGARKKFHGWGGWIGMICVGTFFLFDNYYPGLAVHVYMWPIALICVGLVFIFKPRSKRKHDFFRHHEYWKQRRHEWEQQYREYRPSGEDYLDVTTILSGTKRNILSKDFKGGDIVSILGGTEINLSQADINGRVVIDATQVLGGTKLIVPAHWDVRAEMDSIFGGVEDRRQTGAGTIDHTKILVLKGTSVFGGIEISSY